MAVNTFLDAESKFSIEAFEDLFRELDLFACFAEVVPKVLMTF